MHLHCRFGLHNRTCNSLTKVVSTLNSPSAVALVTPSTKRSANIYKLRLSRLIVFASVLVDSVTIIRLKIKNRQKKNQIKRRNSKGIGAGSGISYTTTPAPPTIAYNVGLKMVGLANDFEVPEQGSAEFNELADRFGRQVENALQAGKVPGFKEAAVTEFVE